MRKIATAAFVSLLAAVTASAQMKPAPSTSTQQSGPVKIEMNKGLQPVPDAPLESAKRIPRDEAMKLVKAKKAIFVDVRSKDSYDAEHIKGAISIPLSDIVARVKEVPRGREIITYCA
jgi:3-mercaptopyruvate sulfurtransferase SseA